MLSIFKKTDLPGAGDALPGRAVPIPTAERHAINGNALKGPYPDGIETIYFGMGCFWGAERLFWQIPGVHVTAVGYQAGLTPNPTYRDVCTGRTGHAETVLVAYDSRRVSVERLLKAFWEEHDPTQGMRQGNDVGTQYRSGIYWTTEAQREAAESTRDAIAEQLAARGLGPVTTEIREAPEFYFAEADHQQYLNKNPGGYCGLRGTGVTCPAAIEA